MNQKYIHFKRIVLFKSELLWGLKTGNNKTGSLNLNCHSPMVRDGTRSCMWGARGIDPLG